MRHRGSDGDFVRGVVRATELRSENGARAVDITNGRLAWTVRGCGRVLKYGVPHRNHNAEHRREESELGGSNSLYMKCASYTYIQQS
jgi:hypothetical protein